MASLAALRARRAELVDEIATAEAARQSAVRAATRAKENLQFATTPQARTAYQSQIQNAEEEARVQARNVATLSGQLAEVDAQIAALERQQGGAIQSSGQTVANAQTANDDRANETAPADDTPQPAAESNAERFTPNQDIATQADVRRIDNLMATPASLPEPGPIRPANPSPSAPTAGGSGAPRDDSGGTGVRARINTLFGGDQNKLIPEDNVLDQYASYTYNISLYLMSPKDYNNFLKSKKKNIAGYQLLMRSGGAPNVGAAAAAINPAAAINADEADAYAQQIRSAQATVATQGRNQFFPLDYYIDDVNIRAVVNGKGTGGAHNAVAIKFRIIEPSGISLLDNLYDAVQQYIALNGGNGKQNYASQHYLMVIKFYGYDQNGNLIPVTGSVKNPDGTPGPAQMVEKFIPFMFTSIKFRIANRVTEYECEAVCPQYMINTGPARGVIPYNIELTSTTLKELLTGNAKFSTTGQTGGTTAAGGARPDGRENATGYYSGGSYEGQVGGEFDAYTDALGQSVTTAGTAATQNSAPPKANAAAVKTIVSGLCDALNGYQKELVDKGVFEYPDKYEIVIVGPELQESKVVPPGETNLRQPPMGPNPNTAPPADTKLPSKGQVNKDARGTKVMAGTSIVQFIDQVTRTSSYIYEQQTKIIDPKTGEPKANGTAAEAIGWYRIGLEAEPQEGKYDSKRNDYAYNIKYQLNIYAVSDVKSDYFSPPKFRGTQKLYNYWFSGQNSQIIDFTQDFNYLFYVVQNTKTEPRNTSNSRELTKGSFQPLSNQSSQGQDNDKVNEPSANAADYLYSPADQAKIKLKIVGDPAWLFQGELWSGIQGPNFNYKPFLPDGTINYEGQEVLFEVAWNRPVDYDLTTGIMNPGQKNYGANQAAGQPGDARQRFIYKATEVTSIFSRGRFEQELQGVMVFFPLPSQQAAAQKSQLVTQQKQSARVAAVGRSAEIPEASPGLLGMDFGETGTVNYKPVGLSTVLDQTRRGTPPPKPSDSAAARLKTRTAPTSGTQAVGTASPFSSEFVNVDPSQDGSREY